MRENWTDKDCDVKYAKYLQDYLNLKELTIKRNSADADILAALEKMKKDRIVKTYDDLFNDVIERIKRKKGSITPKKTAALASRLDKYRSLDDASFDFMYELRKIEEEEY